MRNDGVFVAEDKEIKPYPGVKSLDGEPLYPIAPETEHSIHCGLPREIAAALVQALNEGRWCGLEINRAGQDGDEKGE